MLFSRNLYEHFYYSFLFSTFATFLASYLKRMVGTRHIERRLLRFGFDGLRTSQLQITVCQDKAAVNVPWVCYIHTLYALWPLVYLCTNGNFWYSWLFVHIAWAFSRCSTSTNRGNAKAFKPWSERQCRASRFFYVFIQMINKRLP